MNLYFKLIKGSLFVLFFVLISPTVVQRMYHPECAENVYITLAQNKERRVKVRKPVVAGMFYDSHPQRLKKNVEEYLQKADPKKPGGEVIALISPHAGYTFSGQAAAFGFKLLEKEAIKRAIILAPTHSVPFHGVSIPRVTHYETPLGPVKLDEQACSKLLQQSTFTTVPEAHSREHSLEVQLPFLQVVLGDDFELVPMVIGQLGDGDYELVAGAIKNILKKGDAVIASSDFTHQGPRFGYVPYRTNIKENIKKLDMNAVDFILEKDRKRFLQYVKDTGATICGKDPIGVLLELLPEDAQGRLLEYYTSGDITGGETDTVSYVSLAFASPNGWPEGK